MARLAECRSASSRPLGQKLTTLLKTHPRIQGRGTVASFGHNEARKGSGWRGHAQTGALDVCCGSIWYRVPT
jgi:hypothetical protein